MQITLTQAHDIINSHDGNQDAYIASFSEINNTSYSFTAAWTSYHITLIDSDRSYILLACPLALPPRTGPITLPALAILLTRILDNTVVPVPRPVAHDVSGGEGKWDFGWLLLRLPGPSQADPSASLGSLRHTLSPSQLARVELRLGTYLRSLHDITHDWFGIPGDDPAPEPPSVPSFAALLAADPIGEDGEDMAPYSWQDTFVLRLEDLLERVCGDADARKTASSSCLTSIDADELRRSLTRAVGSFLFEDVEMPRLIWVTGNEDDVVVSLDPDRGRKQGSEQDAEADIAYILPTFGHALWGDPLMEAWFLPPGPSTAMKEGYFGEEDGTLIVFARQETKRVWYTVYLALMVLAEEMSREDGEMTQVSGRESWVQWARSILPGCIETLKNAPCY